MGARASRKSGTVQSWLWVERSWLDSKNLAKGWLGWFLGFWMDVDGWLCVALGLWMDCWRTSVVAQASEIGWEGKLHAYATWHLGFWLDVEGWLGVA